MRYLIDTCVISELIKKRPDRRVVEWVRDRSDTSLFLSVITIGEIEKGIGKLPEGRKKQRLRKWVEEDLSRWFTGRILEIDRPVAVRWGTISGQAEKSGRPIPVLDGLLAATALEAGLALATRNLGHLEETGVPLVDPWSASPGKA